MHFIFYLMLYVILFVFGFLFLWIIQQYFMLKSINDSNSGKSNSNQTRDKKCNVCSSENCNRFNDSNIFGHAFINQEFHVTEKMSNAIIDFFDTVFDNYVYTWYNTLTENKEFLHEARFHLRYSISALLHRVVKCDIPQFVNNHVVSKGVAHYSACSAVIAKGNLGATGNFESHLLRQMKQHLHVALRDRHTEYEYLRHFVASMLPHLLHPSARGSKCMEVFLTELITVAVVLPSIDTLSTPAIINKLIILAFEDYKVPDPTEPPSRTVPLFHTYIKERCQYLTKASHTPASQNIGAIYENHVLRQAFIDFMKFQDALELFIFFGDLEMINKDILSPEIRPSVCVRIYQDVKRLYENLSQESPYIQTALNLHSDFLQLLANVLSNPPSDVGDLRTSSVWFDAHEKVCTFLETYYLSDFFNSDYYIKAVVLEHSVVDVSKSKSSDSSVSQDSGDKQISSTAGKSRFFSSVVDGKALPADVVTAEPALAADFSSLPEPLMDPSKFADNEDMTNWRVAVVGLGDFAGETAGLSSGVMKYIIHIRCVTSDRQWKIYRKYAEFYVLEEKLREFHNALLEDIQLQSKKTFGTSNKEFLNARKNELETFLRNLLSKPFLRQSNLLRMFLTQQTEFESTLLPELNINKFTSKFQRRGFYLAKDFLPSLLAATVSLPPQPATQAESSHNGAHKYPYQQNLLQARLHNSLFWNNASLSEDSQLHRTACSLHAPLVTGIFDLVLYVATKVLSWDNESKKKIVTWILCGLRPIVRPLLDGFVSQLIGYKLQCVLQEHRVIPIISLLKDTLFSHSHKSSDDHDKQQEKRLAMQLLLDTFPNLDVLFGPERQETLLRSIFDLLQHPRLNKQLIYPCLDIALFHLFPELAHSSA